MNIVEFNQFKFEQKKEDLFILHLLTFKINWAFIIGQYNWKNGFNIADSYKKKQNWQ